MNAGVVRWGGVLGAESPRMSAEENTNAGAAIDGVVHGGTIPRRMRNGDGEVVCAGDAIVFHVRFVGLWKNRVRRSGILLMRVWGCGVERMGGIFNLGGLGWCLWMFVVFCDCMLGMNWWFGGKVSWVW